MSTSNSGIECNEVEFVHMYVYICSMYLVGIYVCMVRISVRVFLRIMCIHTYNSLHVQGLCTIKKSIIKC